MRWLQPVCRPTPLLSGTRRLAGSGLAPWCGPGCRSQGSAFRAGPMSSAWQGTKQGPRRPVRSGRRWTHPAASSGKRRWWWSRRHWAAPRWLRPAAAPAGTWPGVLGAAQPRGRSPSLPGQRQWPSALGPAAGRGAGLADWLLLRTWRTRHQAPAGGPYGQPCAHSHLAAGRGGDLGACLHDRRCPGLDRRALRKHRPPAAGGSAGPWPVGVDRSGFTRSHVLRAVRRVAGIPGGRPGTALAPRFGCRSGPGSSGRPHPIANACRSPRKPRQCWRICISG